MTINQHATTKTAKNPMAHGVDTGEGGGGAWGGDAREPVQTKPKSKRRKQEGKHTADRDARVVVREAW